MAVLGIVGDLHEPFTHPMYLDFIQDTFAEWGVEQVHFAGDVADAHAISDWDSDPSGLSAGDEFLRCAERIVEWHDTFPRATVSIGNHDERQFRKARKNGIPDDYLKPYAELWRTPTWTWEFSFRTDGVLLEHGTGSSGKDAAINRAVAKRTSLAMGHVHTYAGVKWHSNDTSRIFGLNVGCGIDCRSYAAAYGRDFPIRPVLGCGIVIDGEYAYFEPMPCGVGQPYHRSRK